MYVVSNRRDFVATAVTQTLYIFLYESKWLVCVLVPHQVPRECDPGQCCSAEGKLLNGTICR
jgi:hypothetical protein